MIYMFYHKILIDTYFLINLYIVNIYIFFIILEYYIAYAIYSRALYIFNTRSRKYNFIYEYMNIYIYKIILYTFIIKGKVI